MKPHDGHGREDVKLIFAGSGTTPHASSLFQQPIVERDQLLHQRTARIGCFITSMTSGRHDCRCNSPKLRRPFATEKLQQERINTPYERKEGNAQELK